MDVCGRHMRHDQILSSKMKQPVLASSRTLRLFTANIFCHFCPYPVIYQPCNVAALKWKRVSYIELPSGSDVFFTPVLMALRARTARISFAPWASWVASCSPRATCRPQRLQRTDAPNRATTRKPRSCLIANLIVKTELSEHTRILYLLCSVPKCLQGALCNGGLWLRSTSSVGPAAFLLARHRVPLAGGQTCSTKPHSSKQMILCLCPSSPG